eukprot:Awhi_evm1s10447
MNRSTLEHNEKETEVKVFTADSGDVVVESNITTCDPDSIKSCSLSFKPNEPSNFTDHCLDLSGQIEINSEI